MADDQSSSRKRKVPKAATIRLIKSFLTFYAVGFFAAVTADGDHRKNVDQKGMINTDKSVNYSNDLKQNTNNMNENRVGINDNLRSDCHCDCPEIEIPECPDKIEFDYGHHPIWYFWAGVISAIITELVVCYGFVRVYKFLKAKWVSKRERRLQEILENNPHLIANSQQIQQRREAQGNFMTMMTTAMQGLTNDQAARGSRSNFDVETVA